MAVVKCKVEWVSDDWSYIVLQGGNQLRYTKIPSSIIVSDDNEKYIYVQKVKDKGKSFKCKLKDVRYDDYYFIKFSIDKDQFIEDMELEIVAKRLYKMWCGIVYEEKCDISEISI